MFFIHTRSLADFYCLVNLMKITPLLTHLLEHCSSFNQQIGIGLDLDALEALPRLNWPQAMVMPICDEASPGTAQNSACQIVRESFGVALMLDWIEGPQA